MRRQEYSAPLLLSTYGEIQSPAVTWQIVYLPSPTVLSNAISLTKEFAYKKLKLRKHPSVPVHETCGCWHLTCQQIAWASKGWSQEDPSLQLSTIKVLSAYCTIRCQHQLCISGFCEIFMHPLHVGAILTMRFITVSQAYIYCINYIPLPTNIFCLIELELIYSLIESRFFDLKRIYSTIPHGNLRIKKIHLYFKMKELWR